MHLMVPSNGDHGCTVEWDENKSTSIWFMSNLITVEAQKYHNLWGRVSSQQLIKRAEAEKRVGLIMISTGSCICMIEEIRQVESWENKDMILWQFRIQVSFIFASWATIITIERSKLQVKCQYAYWPACVRALNSFSNQKSTVLWPYRSATVPYCNRTVPYFNRTVL